MKPLIRTLDNKSIDREKWDQCITTALNARPYALTWYLDHFSPGWSAVILDDYKAVLPLTSRKKYGINYLITPVFIQQLGIFCDEELTPEEYQALLHPLHGFKLIDYCMNTGNEHQADNIKILERKTLELPLKEEYSVLMEKYSSKGRRNVRLARESEPELLSEMSTKDLISLFMEHTGFRIKGIRDLDYRRLHSFIEYVRKAEKGRIYAIREGKKYIYGLFTIEQLDYICCLFTVNSPQSRSARSGYYVIDQLIQKNAGSGKILDFAGSQIPTVASFMKSFGAKEKTYYRLMKNQLPFPLNIFKAIN